MATLFAGPSKLLSNVQNVIRCSQMGYDNARKGNFKRKVQKVFYLPNTILMKRFRKIQETQIVIIFASKCIGWTQGGGGRLYHPPKVFFPPPPSCSCSCSAPSPNAGLKHQAGMAPCHPTCPHYKYQMKEYFFLFIFFFFFANASNIAYWRFFPSWKQLLTERRNEQPALWISEFRPRQDLEAQFQF